MDQLPKTMSAWVSTRLGTPSQSLTLNPSFPAPPPPTGTTILVRVSHAALNPADVNFLAILPTVLPFRRTPIPGLDFSGTVVRSGPDSPLPPGTKVCGSLSVGLVATGHGTLAEFVSVPASLVAVVPAGWDMAAAAGLGIVGQTAHIALVQAVGLGRGSRVLVNGASGGLGSMLAQVCKGKGAWVVGICSGGNGELVKGFGADEIIDYTVHQPLHEYLTQKHGEEQFDYVFDCVGDQGLYERSPPFLKPEGRFICLVGGRTQGVYPFLRNNLLPRFLGGTPRTYKIIGLMPSGEYMREVVRYVEQGLIKRVPIDSEWRMEQAVEAYERVMTKRSRGKVIVKVAP